MRVHTAAMAVGCLLMAAPAAHAQDAKPYDEQLMRLSEILGAVHYLRELCLANDGQRWRDHMRTLIDAETASAQRKARITRSFNQGYRSYSRTYTTCTPSAQTAIERFMIEAVELTDALVEKAP
ncbi:MAG: TIGR02301 family protein [Hyphomicrobium sp.]|nr:TIGR02301 family protein [Hyphomicrobium sp.]PPD08941.1 MAG: TIGR02301 family protein [Hyphomicrobium sp.]